MQSISLSKIVSCRSTLMLLVGGLVTVQLNTGNASIPCVLRCNTFLFCPCLNYEVFHLSSSLYTLKIDRNEIDNMIGHIFTLQGEPAQTATATVDVLILDINDNPPVFTEIISSQLAENVALGSEVLKITTTDMDVGVNARHTFAFTDVVDVFRVEKETGIIRVAGALDREQRTKYVLSVSVKDGAFHPTTQWEVEVLDINDNAPQFERTDYSFEVAETWQVGTLIGRLSASDRDAPGDNSNVFYYLKQPDSCVSVNGTSGDLQVSGELRYSSEVASDNIRQLVVVASDRGDPVLTSQVNVLVMVRAANENPPVFDKSVYELLADENSQINTTVATVSAR